MQWTNEILIGIDEIDAQHRALAEGIALLESAVAKHERWSVVHSALVQLVDGLRIHFAVEESLMRIHGYPEIERHAAEHQAFAERLRQLQALSLSMDVSEDTIAFVQDWKREHIVKSDKHYAARLPAGAMLARVGTDYACAAHAPPSLGPLEPQGETGNEGEAGPV